MNDRILNTEIIDPIRFFRSRGYRSARGLRAIGCGFVRLLGVPWRGPGCEPVLQQVEQAVESRVREVNVRCGRSTINSLAPALVSGLGADLRPELGRWRDILPVLGRIGQYHQIERTGPDKVKNLDLV